PSLRPSSSTPLPYTTLFRSLDVVSTAHHFIGVKLTGDDAHAVATTLRAEVVASRSAQLPARDPRSVASALADLVQAVADGVPRIDRKSTRLNSSHGSISYAV